MSPVLVNPSRFATAAPAITYAAAILADSPALYFKLDEASGSTTTTDSSGNGRNGFATGVTWGQPSLLTDGTGTSASFNGTAFVSASDAAWMNSSTITVEARVKWDGATDQFVASRWVNGGARPWFFHVSSAGKVTGGIDDVAAVVTGATTLSSSLVYTIALRANGTTVQVFVNGVSDGSVSHAGPTQTGSYLALAQAAGGVSTTLRIDDFSFYTTALSDARLAAHHAAA